jgi:hypothetical protein
MFGYSKYRFDVHKTSGAEVLHKRDGFVKLMIQPGLTGNYRLAQLDDGTSRSRNHFNWQPPLTLSLRARVSAEDIPGTWGFGFWNDPFSLSLGLGGGTRRFPAPPNAAWFFYASPQNYLSLRNDLPAKGFMAQTFNSPRYPKPFVALGAMGLPLLLWSLLARKLRSYLRYIIAEDSFAVNINVTQWHNYTLEWHNKLALFKVDNQTFSTGNIPNGPLCFVLWIDNQYASFPPSGKLSYGTLPNHQPAWLEIDALKLE